MFRAAASFFTPSASTPANVTVSPLYKGEEQLGLLLESVKDYAIFTLDVDGLVMSWNAGAQRLLGYQEDEIVGQHFSCLFTPEDVQSGAPEQELNKAREEGRTLNERWHARKNGSRLWGSGTTTPLWNSSLRGFATVMCDRTEQKLAEDALQESEARYRKLAEKLEELNQRKDKFLAMLAHELRNPLAPIASAVHVLRQDRSDNPIQVRARDIIERQVRQLARLVDDLLEASRITAGKIQLRKERIDLRLVVENAVESSRPLIQARKHRLIVELPDESAWADADPARLEQVLLNLINNAAKFTPRAGRIWLSLHVEGNHAVLRVRDTGEGIEAKLLPHVFDLFAQAEQSLERSQGGLGVGLALVRSLIEMHGGTVEAHSEGLGQGAELILRLPRLAAPELPRSAAATPEPENSGSLRILVVDDNIDATSALAMLLRSVGHDVREAHSGEKALETALEYRPDVMLLDVGLPNMSGYEVAQRLREMRDIERAAIIGVSGYGQEDDRQRAEQAGFDDYLTKPLDWPRLQEQLAVLAQRHPHNSPA